MPVKPKFIHLVGLVVDEGDDTVRVRIDDGTPAGSTITLTKRVLASNICIICVLPVSPGQRHSHLNSSGVWPKTGRAYNNHQPVHLECLRPYSSPGQVQTNDPYCPACNPEGTTNG